MHNNSNANTNSDELYLKAVFIDAKKGIKVGVKVMNLLEFILTQYGMYM